MRTWVGAPVVSSLIGPGWLRYIINRAKARIASARVIDVRVAGLKTCVFDWRMQFLVQAQKSRPLASHDVLLM